MAPSTPARLLIAHDGSELAQRGCLLQWACAQDRPVRVALIDPPHGYRNAWYAADPEYADHSGRPCCRTCAACCDHVGIGLGTSLGALATLFIHRRHPAALDAMVLQSGLVLPPGTRRTGVRLDRVRPGVHGGRSGCRRLPAGDVRPVPTLLTVGTVEENRANNERMAGVLAFQRYPLDARLVPDAHTVLGWRDAWSPGMDELLARLP